MLADGSGTEDAGSHSGAGGPPRVGTAELLSLHDDYPGERLDDIDYAEL